MRVNFGDVYLSCALTILFKSTGTRVKIVEFKVIKLNSGAVNDLNTFI